jgi:hypothetical protein
MIARLLTTAAAAVILTGISAASFAQSSTNTMSGQSTATQPMGSSDQTSPSMKPKTKKSSSMKSHSSMNSGSSASSSSTSSGSKTSSSSGKQMAQGHKLDNIADKLNACGGRPAAERQACMDQATHM